jgi:hypothetical protein
MKTLLMVFLAAFLLSGCIIVPPDHPHYYRYYGRPYVY